MKIIKIIMLMFLILNSCDLRPKQNIESKNHRVSIETLEDSDYNIITIDSCEYIIYEHIYPHGFSSSGIVHKQNCKHCLNSNK